MTIARALDRRTFYTWARDRPIVTVKDAAAYIRISCNHIRLELKFFDTNIQNETLV